MVFVENVFLFNVAIGSPVAVGSDVGVKCGGVGSSSPGGPWLLLAARDVG